MNARLALVRIVFTTVLPALILSTISAPPCLAADESGFVNLFDGKSLDGWVQRGGKAKYTVEEGVIVGTTVPNTPNSFLCTKKNYADFILEVEFKVDPSINSGIQIRSESRKDYRAGRVHGYQVEIDPSERAWSAGIYDESRRGWINNLANNQPARKAFKQNQWNKYRIECIGDHILTWINGTAAADLVDSLTLDGFIALQVHSYRGETPVQVRWRNLRIKDLGRHQWKPLFDGKTTKGWTAEGGGTWKVNDDGLLVGSNVKSQPRHGHLFLGRQLDDFTIRVEYKATAGNSGVYFRTEKTKGNIGIKGFQAEIDAAADAGGLYETSGRGWVVQPKGEDVKKYFKPGQWNEMTVSAHGRRIVVHVNGRKSAELMNDPGRTGGWLALQTHGGQDMRVMFRKIEILSPTGE